MQSESERAAAVSAFTVHGASLSDLTLDFTLPGYEIELKDGGKDIHVDSSNLEEYMSLVIDWTLRKGVMLQLNEFKLGFSSGKPTSRAPTLCSSTDLVFLLASLFGPRSSEFHAFRACDDDRYSRRGLVCRRFASLLCVHPSLWHELILALSGLTNAAKADHGFTMDSRPVRDLISIMSELTPSERREFLSFITGS